MSAPIPRNVFVDLLPLYVSGEASAETNALVEARLREDPELERLAHRARLDLGGGVSRAGTELPGDLELRSLRRTQLLLRWQRIAFSWSVTFTALSLATAISFDGQNWQARPLLFGHPQLFWPCVGLAVSGWVHYVFFVQRRLRFTRL
ncbi:MAG: hypothetical protein ABJC89_12780 [Acidobacteriota bacterium]